MSYPAQADGLGKYDKVSPRVGSCLVLSKKKMMIIKPMKRHHQTSERQHEPTWADD